MDQRLDQLLLRVYEHHLKRVFEIIEREGVQAVLLKGWSAARFYDDPAERTPGDFDLMVSPDAPLRVDALFSTERDILADIHRGPRHLDTLSFEELFARSETIDLEGVPIRVLCPEDHLRVLCVHWLTDGGERKERLWDIYWAVKNRPSAFDWDKCLGVVSERRRRWIICTIGLAQKHLGLEIEDLPFAEDARDLPHWLTRAIEKRWEEGIPHLPLHHSIGNAALFAKQLRKRFPPNPVMAMIGMEGDIDARTRIHYQIGYIFKQSVPSIRRMIPAIRRRF
ncbi:MAG TPA: nucleotidyltransferase family protein [Aridibacter sp.]|nr:nucleotidyltransferase family protein [Aridibacter sp.]